jgi:hypothetical protein
MAKGIANRQFQNIYLSTFSFVLNQVTLLFSVCQTLNGSMTETSASVSSPEELG